MDYKDNNSPLRRSEPRSSVTRMSSERQTLDELELTPPRGHSVDSLDIIGRVSTGSTLISRSEERNLLPMPPTSSKAKNETSPDTKKKDALVGQGMSVNGAAIAKNPRTKWVAYVVLVFVECSIGLLGKIAQTDGHKFAFSPVSAICMAEMIKLILSGVFLHVETGSISNAMCKIRSEINFGVSVLTAGLAFMYCFNNQLHFYLMTFIDPGTFFLSKAGATLIVASLQFTLLNRFFSEFQWRAMACQVLGVVMVQFDPVKVSFEYALPAYLLLITSVLVTALCTVQNEHLLKTYKVGINVQNFLLYAFGVVFNFIGYQMPNPYSTSHSFFDGYDRFTAVATIVCNAFLGLAITAVYKYADAVTKTMATDATSVILVVVSVIFFDFSGRFFVWVGTAITLTAIHFNQEHARRREEEADRLRDSDLLGSELRSPKRERSNELSGLMDSGVDSVGGSFV